MVKGMIKLNPRERLTIPQILAHSWLKETNDDESDEDEEEKTDENGVEHGKNDKSATMQQQKSQDIDLKSI